jgi:hypothetical protein
MPADAVRVRAYADGDETAILDLFARSFHASRPLEHWRWKYEQNPFGNHHISVGFADAQLVSHYSGYPLPFYAFGKELIAHQIGDTMTEPSVRHIGRGPTSILGRTALHFYETFCERRVAFNFGFNVANIQKFSLRFLRSDRVEPVPYFAVDAARLRRIRRVERWARGYQFPLCDTIGDEFTTFFRTVAPSYRFLLRRDAAYLRWRYLSCPDIRYSVVALRKWRHLVGWLVFRIRDNRLSVGDLLIHPAHGDVVEAVMRHLAHVYRVDTIDGWFAPRPGWLAESLGQAGFVPRPEPQDLSLMCVPFEWPEAPQEMRLSLYYTMGDGDLF